MDLLKDNYADRSGVHVEPIKRQLHKTTSGLIARSFIYIPLTVDQAH